GDEPGRVLVPVATRAQADGPPVQAANRHRRPAEDRRILAAGVVVLVVQVGIDYPRGVARRVKELCAATDLRHPADVEVLDEDALPERHARADPEIDLLAE